MPSCSTCYAEIPLGVGFCPECGSKAPASGAPVSKPVTSGGGSSGGQNCSNCGAFVPVGAGFCPECGTKPSGSKGGGGGGGSGGSSLGGGGTTSSYTPPPQPKQTSKNCVNCGNQVPSDARFCSECGSNPDVKAQPKQTQQSSQPTQQFSQPSRQATASTGYGGESGGSGGGGSLGTCYGCGRQIENKVVTALDKPWHPECFKCAGCGSPFSTGSGGGTFMIRDDRPYCQSCTDKTLGVCAGCGGKLTGAVLTALDKQWHPACFVCAGCKKAFTGGKFKMSPLRQGVPYCEVCVTKVQ